MSGARIAIVNDDATQLMLMGGVLRAAGYRVTTFESGADTLAEIEAGGVDLFVVDLHMPGIDGWKLCRLLRSPDFPAFNDVPILVVSATFSGADVEAITADLGANAFLSVPYGRQELLRFTRDLLSGVRPRQRPGVLVVEDDPGVADAVRRVFEQNGFDVVCTTHVDDARDAWHERPFDVVLLDYHLPDGTCERLLEECHHPSQHTVALVMTGDDDPALGVRMLDKGADSCIRKPFDPGLLVELARKAQRERSLLRVEAILETRTQQLKASEERFRSLFNSIPELVLAVDRGGSVVSANRASDAFLGREPDDLVGRELVHLVPSDDRIELLDAVRRLWKGEGEGLETRLIRGDGVVDVEMSGTRGEQDGVQVLLLVARDLTLRRELEAERDRLQERANHAQRLESLGVMAGGIAHDFNNLLVGILGNASLALMDAPAAGGQRDALRQIETAARRAAELTQQILTFSGQGNVLPRPLDLSHLVDEMGMLLEPAISKKAEVFYRLPSSLPRVRGDASQVRQVIMNLLMNASEALEDRPGTIVVQTGRMRLEATDMRRFFLGPTSKPGEYAFIDVQDDGCGMDTTTRQRMFDPFFTTKFTGRGLGLAATLGIVRAHGGALEVESEPGDGTRFRVLLPAHDADIDEGGERDPEKAEPWTEGGLVLIADDEGSVRQLASATLRRAGFDLVEAANGQEALDVFAAHPRIALVLLDLTMPVLDGKEVLAGLRSAAPNLPVILSSGYGPETLPEGLLDDPATDFIRKPYPPSELAAAAGRALHAARTRATLRLVEG